MTAQGPDPVLSFRQELSEALMDVRDHAEDRERIKLALGKLRLLKQRVNAYKTQVAADFQQRSQQMTQAHGTRSAVLGQRRKGFFGTLNTVARVQQQSERANLQGQKAAFNQQIANLKWRLTKPSLRSKNRTWRFAVECQGPSESRSASRYCAQSDALPGSASMAAARFNAAR